MNRHILLFVLAASLSLAQTRPAAARKPAAAALPTVTGISADLLKAHVAFLSSDALEGRATPSRGQDAAAEYIASQFRRIGLEPQSQDVKLVRRTGTTDGFEAILKVGTQEWKLSPADVTVRGFQELNLRDEPIVKLNSLDDIGKIDIAGKVVVTPIPPAPGNRFRIAMLNPKVVLYAGPKPRQPGGGVLDPTEAQTTGIITDREDIKQAIDALPDGATLSVTLPAPKDEPIRARNLYAILPGSDPVLKDTYVVLSAHYDHIGTKSSGDDRIYNGANDNASGTAAVLGLAEALAPRKPRPKRSIVFLLVTAEEVGLLGSRYFIAHPVLPVKQIVADINLEQVGRTDNKDQSTKGAALMTGFEFSDLGSILKRAGAANGIRLVEDTKNSRAFFLRSDNAAFAQAGIPSATYAGAFEFPDYHEVGDEYQKLDYANMVQLTKTVGTAALVIANSPKPLEWNKTDAEAAKYAAARK